VILSLSGPVKGRLPVQETLLQPSARRGHWGSCIILHRLQKLSILTTKTERLKMLRTFWGREDCDD
jgi:hypothetical protein